MRGPDRIDRPRTLINHAGLLERFDEWGVIAPVQINEILQLQVPNETREKIISGQKSHQAVNIYTKTSIRAKPERDSYGTV